MKRGKIFFALLILTAAGAGLWKYIQQETGKHYLDTAGLNISRPPILPPSPKLPKGPTPSALSPSAPAAPVRKPPTPRRPKLPRKEIARRESAGDFVRLTRRYEKKYEPAINVINKILADVSSESDWYVYFSTNIILACVYADQGEFEKAASIVDLLKSLYSGRNFKLVQVQLRDLEKKLKDYTGFSVLKVTYHCGQNTFIYEKKTLTLKDTSPTEKLLVLFAKEKFLKKGM